MTREEQQPVSGIPCVSCGYDLTGLTADRNCPECGTPVRESENPLLMRYERYEGVQRVLRGTRLIFWTYIASIALFVLAILIAVMAAIAGNNVDLFTHPVVSMSTSVLFSGVIILGWYWTTTPLHKMPESESNARLRGAILGLLVLGLALSVAVDALTSYGPSVKSSVLWQNSAFFLSTAIALFAECAKLTYLKRLMLFIPDWTLAGRAQLMRRFIAILMLGFLGVLGILVAIEPSLFTAAPFEEAGTGPGRGDAAITVLWMGYGLAYLVYFFCFIVLIAKAGNRVAAAFNAIQANRIAREYGQGVGSR